MRLTEKWKDVFPADIVDSYVFAETRDAAAILQATEPEAFEDIIAVLREFSVDLNMLYRPGGRLSKIAEVLDLRFHEKGWREARYSQQLTTKLETFPWSQALGEKKTVVEAATEAEGHKIDNVKGRAVVDIEWNPKDGNLDRDLSNYVALYNGGIINVGVLLIRSAAFAEPTLRMFEEVRELQGLVPKDVVTPNWLYRIEKTPEDPYATSTTANYEKLVPRLQRGDGQGCPILAIGITWDRFKEPELGLRNEVNKIAQLEEPKLPQSRQAYYIKRWHEFQARI